MFKFFKPKFLIKIIWFGFGLFGLYIVFKQYLPDFWPNLKNSDLVKGVQSELIKTQSADFSSTPASPIDLTNLNPEEAGQAIAKIVSQQITEVIKNTTSQVKEFPQKQVRKIKINACEELLEEDICSVAKEIKCQN